MLVLERRYGPNVTSGILHAYHGWQIPTLELPWRNNARNVSCIPEGRYHLERDRHGVHQFYRISDGEVIPRSAIEVHFGQRPQNSRGCILIPDEGDLRFLLGSSPVGDLLWIRSDTGMPSDADQ